MGIPSDELPRVFARYFRARTAPRGRQGLGLGLYITRMLVQAHGGRIWVESEGGVGSTFSFSLPVARSEALLMALGARHPLTPTPGS